MTNDEHSQQTESEGSDWFQIAFGVALIVILILAAIGGHHEVSLAVHP